MPQALSAFRLEAQEGDLQGLGGEEAEGTRFWLQQQQQQQQQQQEHYQQQEHACLPTVCQQSDLQAHQSGQHLQLGISHCLVNDEQQWQEGAKQQQQQQQRQEGAKQQQQQQQMCLSRATSQYEGEEEGEGREGGGEAEQSMRRSVNDLLGSGPSTPCLAALRASVDDSKCVTPPLVLEGYPVTAPPATHASVYPPWSVPGQLMAHLQLPPACFEGSEAAAGEGHCHGPVDSTRGAGMHREWLMQAAAAASATVPWTVHAPTFAAGAGATGAEGSERRRTCAEARYHDGAAASGSVATHRHADPGGNGRSNGVAGNRVQNSQQKQQHLEDDPAASRTTHQPHPDGNSRSTAGGALSSSSSYCEEHCLPVEALTLDVTRSTWGADNVSFAGILRNSASQGRNGSSTCGEAQDSLQQQQQQQQQQHCAEGKAWLHGSSSSSSGGNSSVLAPTTPCQKSERALPGVMPSETTMLPPPSTRYLNSQGGQCHQQQHYQQQQQQQQHYQQQQQHYQQQQQQQQYQQQQLHHYQQQQAPASVSSGQAEWLLGVRGHTSACNGTAAMQNGWQKEDPSYGAPLEAVQPSFPASFYDQTAACAVYAEHAEAAAAATAVGGAGHHRGISSAGGEGSYGGYGDAWCRERVHPQVWATPVTGNEKRFRLAV